MAKTKAKKKPQHGKGSTGSRVAGLPVASVVVKQAREEELTDKKAGALTMDEKIGILKDYETETDTNIIAQKYNRSPEAIRKFIWRYASTTDLAKKRISAGAEELADRIVEMSNVDQALEVMDRLGVLEKKRDKHAPATSFTLVVGMPVVAKSGQKALDAVPVPTQELIEAARIIEAEAEEVTD